ncbi:MAG: hypothetical protein ABFS37_15665 [Acidobacteriota bacterium]
MNQINRVLTFVVCIGLSITAQAADSGKGQEVSGGPIGIESIGGPDGFGYGYIDSNESNGQQPTFSFVDITATGTALGLTDDGEADVVISSFVFPFYGLNYTDVRVGNNGGLLLGTPGDGDVSATTQCPMPWVALPLPAINVFWDDIDDETGNVFVEEQASCAHPDCSGACLIVEWFDRPHFNNVGSVTFEVILCDSGDIIAQYEDVVFGNPSYDYGAAAAVGIEADHQDPTFFLQYSCGTADLSDGLAIKYTTGPVPVELMSLDVE